jgi:hypothetical protein
VPAAFRGPARHRRTGVAVCVGQQVLAAAAAQHEGGEDDNDDDHEDEEHSFAPSDDTWALAAGRRLIPGVCFPSYTGDD